MNFYALDYRQLAIALAVGMTLTSCASGTKTSPFPAGTDPTSKVTEVRTQLESDRAQQFDQMSPEHFAQAEKSLANAKGKLEKGESAEKILNDLADSSSNLRAVEENSRKYSEQLSPVLSARQAAITAQAARVASEELASADKDFRYFGREIEKSDFHPEGKEISKLESKYSDVELKAVKLTTLGNCRDILNRTDKQGARKKAPKTFEAAHVQYDSALRSVEANRRNPSGYAAAVAQSNQAANKLEQVMATIQSTGSNELAAVQIYEQKQQLAESRQNLESTQKTLTQTEDQAHQAQERATALQTEQSNTVAALQGQNDRYADKAAMNSQIDKVKGEFSSDEAEVLRDGNKIILRLKTMKFKSARTELTDSSIGTLQKVKDMIAAVPVSKVVVEGHTDSVGGEKKNLELSQKRAETVEKYLVAEKALTQDQIEAKGFGYQRPLTSNKTSQGRAINRRVDVVIESATDL